jgi:predicted metalloprotease
MRWRGRRQSSNVEDRRRISGKGMALGGGLGTVVIVLLFALLGGNPEEVIQNLDLGTNVQQQAGPQGALPDDELAQFISVVLADTEDVWKMIFRESGLTYREPTLVLFRGQTQSACGFSNAASGPFYCPADEKIYIDLTFLEDIQRQLQATGDFAMAYILAHEVGHHVQNLLGVMDKMPSMQNPFGPSREKNQFIVRMELQADFLAGVWAHHAQKMKNILEAGDVEEAIRAAGAVGDDRIQMRTQGYVVPDSFTHGTSEQRVRWLKKGMQTGDPSQGDTFNARNL